MIAFARVHRMAFAGLAALAGGAIAALAPASAQELETGPGAAYSAPYHSGRGVRSYAPMLREVSRSVVRVRAFHIDEDNRDASSVTTGAGVVANASQGLVITSAHLVDDATLISVTGPDGAESTASLRGLDVNTDIALIEADVDGATSARFVDSALVEPGDVVFAIGYPRALDQTITAGIISGVARQGIAPGGLGAHGLDEFIQTDAAMHPGNSGGPLVDSAGRVIGINTFILSESGDDSGLNFTTPSRFVMTVVRQLERYGEARRGVIGVRVDTLRAEAAETLGVSVRSGAVVLEVAPGSPAEAAGFQAGDVVTGAGSERIDNRTDFLNFWLLTEPGVAYPVFVRRGEQVLQLTLALAAPNLDHAGEARGLSATSAFVLGALFVDPPQRLDRDEPAAQGARAAVVPEGSEAERLGLRVNDVIVSVDRAPVASVRALSEAIRASSEETALLVVNRGEDGEFIVFAPT